jgi:glycosyltransferase involved in cell wall biosynthesis
MKVPISIIIPVKNEEKNLKKSLSSVLWADEIFVVDSNSTDKTLEIANDFKTKIVQFEFNGTWPKKKNWSLENLPFKNEWVFVLDADEVLHDDAEEEFRKIVTTSNHKNVGYWINRRFMFMGKWLENAYYPNWNLRLFKHKLGRYEKLTEIDTQSGDNEVHEHVLVEGKTAHLRTEMDHYAFPSVDVFVEKHNRYSNWEARVSVDRFLNEKSTLQQGNVNKRRLLKKISQKLPFRPTLRFLYVFLWQKGFLDGKEGYYFARMHAMYEMLCVAKTFEMKKCTNRK